MYPKKHDNNAWQQRPSTPYEEKKVFILKDAKL